MIGPNQEGLAQLFILMVGDADDVQPLPGGDIVFAAPLLSCFDSLHIQASKIGFDPLKSMAVAYAELVEGLHGSEDIQLQAGVAGELTIH